MIPVCRVQEWLGHRLGRTRVLEYIDEQMAEAGVTYVRKCVQRMGPTICQYPIQRPRRMCLYWRDDLGAPDVLAQPLTILLQGTYPETVDYLTMLKIASTVDWSRVDKHPTQEDDNCKDIGHGGDQVFDLDEELTQRTSGTSGEARFLWLHAKDGGAQGLLEAAQVHSDVAWVVAIEQILDECWFGTHVTPEARMRMGEVAIVARDPIALMDPRQPDAPQLVARHGSMTPEEMLVPFISFS